jgi:hypothetical protein
MAMLKNQRVHHQMQRRMMMVRTNIMITIITTIMEIIDHGSLIIDRNTKHNNDNEYVFFLSMYQYSTIVIQ